MLPLTLTLLLSALSSTVAAVPANHLEGRQGDVTFTITCLPPRCTDYPPTTLDLPTTFPGIPGEPQKPTTTPKTSAKTSSTITSKKTTSSITSSKKTSSSTSKYTPPTVTTIPTKTTKSTQKPSTTTETGEVGPSSTRCPVPLYYQCGGWYGGKPWTGCTKCATGAKCLYDSEYYSQCVADD